VGTLPAVFGFKRQKSEAFQAAVAEEAEPAGEEPADGLSPLVDRLARLQWPEASDEVRDRCLHEVMSRVRETGDDQA
jgi:hypothetical protein